MPASRVLRRAVVPALFCLMFSAGAQAADPTEAKTITGAGEHFSWVILDELKPGLERRHDRTTKLFGKESMLGAGCSTGIKKARENRPGHGPSGSSVAR